MGHCCAGVQEEPISVNVVSGAAESETHVHGEEASSSLVVSSNAIQEETLVSRIYLKKLRVFFF